MNKKILIIITLIILVFGTGYFLHDSLNYNNSVFGVSHFNQDNISFKYPKIWLSWISDSNYSFIGPHCLMELDIYDINGTSIDDLLELLLHNDSDPQINYTVLSINQTNVDGIVAYEINSKYDMDEGEYVKFLVFQYNATIYMFYFHSDNLNKVNNDFNLVKNSIKVK